MNGYSASTLPKPAAKNISLPFDAIMTLP